MSRKITDLFNNCQRLSSSKVTDQNKGLEGIRIFIEDSELVTHLNESTDTKKGPNWNHVFKTVYEYLEKECATLFKQYNIWAASTRNSKIKKVQDILTLNQKILQAANSGLARIKVATFLDFLIECLNKDVFVENFGVMILTMIQKDILWEKKYICELKHKIYNDLYNICKRELIQDCDAKTKFASSALFQSLTSALVLQSDPCNYHHLYPIFVEVFKKSLSNVKTSAIWDNILTAINSYINWYGVTCRIRCCHLGEDSLDVVLCTWSGNSLPETTLQLITEFCFCQILLHYPGKMITVSSGAYANDTVTWHTQLCSILVATEMQLAKQSNTQSYRFNKTDKEVVFNEGCIKLAASACCVLFNLHLKNEFRGAISTMNQLSDLMLNKIDFADKSSFSALFTFEKGNKIKDGLQHWMKILTCLLQSDINFLGVNAALKVASQLGSILVNINIDIVGANGLNCLSVLLECISHHVPEHLLSYDSELAIIWKDCWTVAATYLTQATKSPIANYVFDFLTALVQLDKKCRANFFVTTRCAKNMQSLWSSLFLHIVPNDNCLKFINIFIDTYGLHSTHADVAVFSTLLQSSASDINIVNFESYSVISQRDPLKVMLLQWIMGYKENVENYFPPQNTRFGNCSQMPLEDCVVKSVPIFNILLNKTEKIKIDANNVVSVLIMLCEKSVASSTESCSISSNIDHTTAFFTKMCNPDFTALFKHFNSRTMNGNEINAPKKKFNCSLSKDMLGYLFHILNTSLNVILTSTANTFNSNSSHDLYNLCESFFFVSNIAGLLVREISSFEKYRTEVVNFFGHWVAHINDMMKTILSSVNKWSSLRNDSDFMLLLFCKFEELFKILQASQFENFSDKFLSNRELQTYIHNICEMALFVLKSSSTDALLSKLNHRQSSSNEAVGDDFDLTQSSLSRSSTGGSSSGSFKRRRYGCNTDQPTPKHKKRSNFQIQGMCAHCTCDQTQSTYVFCECKTLNNMAMALICTAHQFLHSSSFVKKAFEVTQDFEFGLFQNLEMIHIILKKFSSGCINNIELILDALEIFHDVFKSWYKDQYVCSKFLVILSDVLSNCSKSCQELSDLIEKTCDILNGFWKMILKRKCSPLVQMGFAMCLHSLMKIEQSNDFTSSTLSQKVLKELNFGNYFDSYFALLHLSLELHDGVKFISVLLLKSLFSASQNHFKLFRAMQSELFSFVSNHAENTLIGHAAESSEALCINVENFTSSMSSLLHLIFAAIPYPTQSEETAHALLCFLAGICKKRNLTAYSQVSRPLISSCFDSMARDALQFKFTDDHDYEMHLSKYRLRHLTYVFKNLVVTNESEILDILRSFPCDVFKYKSMQQLCVENRKFIFPFVFFKSLTIQDLEMVMKLYFSPSNQTVTLKEIVKYCAPEILSLFFEELLQKNSLKLDEKVTSSKFDGVFQTSNVIFSLVHLHFAYILVDVLTHVETCDGNPPSTENTLSAIRYLVKYYDFKNAPHIDKYNENKLFIAVANAVFVRRSDGCILVQVLLLFRKLIYESWYPDELLHHIKAYKCFIAIVLKSNKIPDDYISFLMKDLVYFVGFFTNKLEKRFKDVQEHMNKIYFMHGSTACLDILILVCEYSKKSSSAYVANCFNQWEIAVPFVSSIKLLESFSAILDPKEYQEKWTVLKKSLDEKLVYLLRAIKTTIYSENLSKLLALFSIADAPDSSAASLYMDIFLNSYQVLKDHDMLGFQNPVIDKIMKYLAEVLKDLRRSHTASQISVSPYKTLHDVMDSLMKLSSHSYPCSVSAFDCIAELVLFLSKNPPPKLERDFDYTNFRLTHDILRILSTRITSYHQPLARDTINSLYQLFQLPNLDNHMKQIKVLDPFLADVLIPFRVELSVNLQSTHLPGSMDELTLLLSHTDIFGKSYKEWICHLTSGLVHLTQNKLFHTLKSVCSCDASLCSIILPSVIHDILVNDDTGEAKACLSEYIEKCFQTFLCLHESNQHVKHDNNALMQSLLNIIQFLRTRNISENSLRRRSERAGMEQSKSSSWDNNFWLNVNYLTAANVAVLCGQPYKAVLFMEIWLECNIMRSGNQNSTVIDLTNDINDGHICATKNAQSENVLMNAFSIINDVDSLHGLRKNCIDESQVMVHIHEKEKDWMEALYCYDFQLTKNVFETEVNDKILSALDRSGLNDVSSTYLAGMKSLLADCQNVNSQKWLTERQYQSASNMSQWKSDANFDRPESSNLNVKGFQEKFFDCMYLVNDSETHAITHINLLRKEVLNSIPTYKSQLCHLDLDILSRLAKLVCLRELADVYHLVIDNRQASITEVFDSWEKTFLNRDTILESTFECSNFVLSNRCNFIQIMKPKFVNSGASFQIIEFNEGTQMKKISTLVHGGSGRVALQNLISLRKNLKTDDSQSFKYFKALLDEAVLLWKLSKKSEALSISQQLHKSLETSIAQNENLKFELGYLLGRTLQLRGEWLDFSKMEGPSTIMEDYLGKSVKLAERLVKRKPGTVSSVADIEIQSLCVSGYKSLARYADNQYTEVISYMKSNEFEHKRNLVRDAQEELKKAQSKNNSQSQKYIILLQKNYKMDHKVFNDIIEKKEKFLLCALENYVKCISLSDYDDILMYRVCSLWFTNTTAQSIPGLMECACKQISTHKFVQLSYQLAARLDSSSSDKNFQSTLQNLLYRMAIDHPHHVLPVILALANAHRDSEVVKPNPKRAKTVHDSTSLVAKAIVAKVKSSNPTLVTLMENLSDAYIQLANFDASRWSKMASVPINFDENLLISKYCTTRQNDTYSSLAIPTVDIPIIKNSKYEEMSNFVSLRFFKPYFSLCGGINLPKIVIAIGSDGRERKHLVKGRDDLRQDAVMQQVFKVVNTLLSKHEGSNQLQLRTYKVIPLSQRSGLVEWCEGTIPIGTYLIGTPAQKDYGAHHRYRPKDNLSLDCRRKLSAASGKPRHQKLEVFKDICNNFKPVFRHFFYEHFVDPLHWYERRTAYCKSVAASSVVGYILGLGDRHVQNILVDRSTGEVIHIDLGVAFEQGKCLPTPEMVPFRLTRDMVDGFGSSGVQGPFKRNCERTMTVLRNSIETISTIVEVLLHDPLHDWMMTSGKAMQIQRNMPGNHESEMTSSVLNASTVAELLNDNLNTTTATNRSSLAGRALLRVQEKLRGLESGAVLSVEGQINLLIQQATDYERLCAMFAGWQPYI